MEQQIVQICWGFRTAKSGRLAPLNLAPNADGSGPRRPAVGICCLPSSASVRIRAAWKRTPTKATLLLWPSEKEQATFLD
jgi:hypothetical protein